MKLIVLILAVTSTALAQEAQTVTAEPVAQQPAQVVIIQESAPAATLPEAAPQAVITQPTTVVEDSPLVESKAEKLRRVRQNAEVETEQKIVEKLEESRLQDEQERMDNLFGDKLDAKKAEPAPAVAAPVVVVPAVAAPVEEKKSEEINKDELKAEIAESVKADLNALKEAEKKPEFKKRMVIGAGAGTIDYASGGIESDFAGGFTLGYEFRERMELEAGFTVSEHTAIEYIPFGYSIQNMDQYNFSVGMRYSVLPYFVSPVVGAMLSYTHRVYDIPLVPEREIETDALDAGFLVGLDVLLSDNMSVTMDYRRFVNIQSRVNNNALLTATNYNKFEDSDYDMVNLALRFMF